MKRFVPPSPGGRARALRLPLAAAALSVLCLLALAGRTDAATVTEFPEVIAGSAPLGIAAGADGNLWFTEVAGSRIGRLTTTGSAVDFSTGSGISTGSRPWGIAAGPDGNLWFTEESGNRVGRITTGAKGTEFSAGISADAAPRGIAAGPDGNLWFAEDAGRIGRITTAGVVTEFSEGITSGARPLGVTGGPDGNVWFTEQADRIGRITSAGAITEFSAGITAGSLPSEIVAGPDGNLWFTEFSGDRIGRITPSGVVTEFAAGITAGAEPRGITVGPDGNLWFAEEGIDRIARITPAGAVTEFSSGISPRSGPTLIALGSDGNLWFTEAGGFGRARLEPAVVTGAASSIGSTTATLSGTVNRFAQPTSHVFEYGRTTAYGSATSSQTVSTGNGEQAVSAQASDLQPSTLYHYRLVATSAGGTTPGADRTFTTAGSGTGGGGGGGGSSSRSDRSGPKLTLSGRSLTVTRAGRVAISLGCPLAETLGCRGNVKLATANKLRLSRSHAAPARRLRLGSAGFHIGGGQTKTVTIRLSRRDRALVRRLHRLRVVATVTGSDASGNSKTTVKRQSLLASQSARPRGGRPPA
jgi:streptogramin lyase